MARIIVGGFLPADHPLFQQGVTLVGVNRFKPTKDSIELTTDGVPKTPKTSEPVEENQNANSTNKYPT